MVSSKCFRETGVSPESKATQDLLLLINLVIVFTGIH
jgi:hypothetical protein